MIVTSIVLAGLAGAARADDVERRITDHYFSCDAGRADACYRLALETPPGSHDRASLLRRACDGGVDDACDALARLYLRAADPDMDRAASNRALERLCDDHRDALACGFAAGFHRGHEEPWLIKACDAGQYETCALVGRRLYVAGKRGLALRVLSRGCSGGDQDSCTWRARARKKPR